MFNKIIRILGGDPLKREVERLSQIAEQINELEPTFEAISEDELSAKTGEFKQRLADGESLDDLLPEAFAVVREASKRTIGLRHYDVQMVGGVVLHQGKIAEMRTGEGKTLVATLPLYLNALTGRGVHLITVNDYLARYHARLMAPIYNLLGMNVGVLQMASRTENGRKAFIVDLEKSSPFEDQDQLRMVDRCEAYKADITYGMNSEFGFDFLRDNLTYRLSDRVQQGHYYAIVDEVDNILIDEARTPLIISGPAADDAKQYYEMAQVVRALKPEDYEISEKDHTVSMTEAGEAHVEELLGKTLRDPDRPEDINPEQARLMGFLEQSLRAQFLYRRNKDYLVQAGKVVIVDEFTGRLMPGRRWSEGLHQAVEAKEGVKVEPENITYATITIQNYFRMYDKLAGMTGTGLTEAEEFNKIYKLEVQPIPTNLEYAVMRPNAELMELEGKDESGYKMSYYVSKDDSTRTPLFWRRKDYPDVVYRTEEAKLRAIIEEILRYYVLGRPQLVGTTSVEHSERLSSRLKAEPIRRLLQVILVRRAWMEKNQVDFIETRIGELEFLNRPLDDINPGELRQAAKPLGLSSINPEDPDNLDMLIRALDVTKDEKERLVKTIQGGVPHQVLNARKHDEESQIIARAGSYGMVTIATNMAGRGVDIKLGGELPEDILAGVIRVLHRFAENPYDMSNEQRREALLALPREEYGIYTEAVDAFLEYMSNMERVRALGGLHVIGSERHEARRIDNQLRGRSARQGDPGSSRFYLSLEDELMRLFGGAQVDNLIKRLNIDDAYPIEHNLLGRLVEQAQERVEGNNFDVRKHLLEYDDVLNTQRQRIYAQRDRVFTKPDLTEDVIEMLETDLNLRVPEALKDEDEGPWRLLAFMNEVQPTLDFEGVLYPTMAMRLLVDDLKDQLAKTPGTVYDMREACLDMAARALQVENEHILNSARTLLERTSEALEHQRDERFEVLDNYFESLQNGNEDEEKALQRRPQEIAEELGGLLRINIRLTPEQLRQLADGQEAVKAVIQEQVEASLLAVAVTRTVIALERRVENLGFKPGQLQDLTWPEISASLLQSVESGLNAKAERLIGNNGQIAHDIDPLIEKLKNTPILDRNLMAMLSFMAQGSRMAFDKRTHRQATVRFNRLNYIYLAARQLEGRPAKEVTEQVLDHASGALEALKQIWGLAEWKRLNQNEVTLNQLDERHQEYLSDQTGVEKMNEIGGRPLTEFSLEDRKQVVEALGQRLLNESFRELLLSVISQAWVDYLTRVEALRVSIGLEAYAQRDPLVMYKGKATELFQELLKEIRSGVVNRMFTFRPSRAASVSIDRERGELPEEVESAEVSEPVADVTEEPGSGGKKKRRRH
jgi:preprotein translocase subunit SecA